MKLKVKMKDGVPKMELPPFHKKIARGQTITVGEAIDHFYAPEQAKKVKERLGAGVHKEIATHVTNERDSPFAGYNRKDRMDPSAFENEPPPFLLNEYEDQIVLNSPYVTKENIDEIIGHEIDHALDPRVGYSKAKTFVSNVDDIATRRKVLEGMNRTNIYVNKEPYVNDQELSAMWVGNLRKNSRVIEDEKDFNEYFDILDRNTPHEEPESAMLRMVIDLAKDKPNIKGFLKEISLKK